MADGSERERTFHDPGVYAVALGAFLAEEPRLAAFQGYRAPDLETSARRGSELQRILFDEEWSRVGWPERFGGLGGNPLCRAAMFETLTAADIPLPETYLTLEILVPVLIEHAPHLAQRYFAPLLAGEEMWCQAFSEPDAGSDLASLRTRMEPEGDDWRVTGQKVWSSFGHLAQRCVLLARSGGPGHRGLTMVLIDLDQPGVSVTPIRTEDGEHHFVEIFFDGAHLPGDRVIGEPGTGWGVAMYMLQWERGAFGWQQQGRFHQRLETALRQREPSDVAVEALGRAYLAVTALRLRTRDTVRRLAKAETLGPDTSVDKLLLVAAERAAFDVARHTVRPLLELDDTEGQGGWWRSEFLYSRAAPIYGGSQEIQRTLVAQRILGLPREP